MKIQKPQYEIWMQNPGELGIYQQIERAGRVCYKSENNTTEDSAKPFVGRMIEHEHYAMLEHGTVYLTCNHGELPLYASNKFSHVNTIVIAPTPWQNRVHATAIIRRISLVAKSVSTFQLG